MTKEPIAVLDNLSYMYPTSEKTVLTDINLNIRQGEFLGIIGPTGAGKSTLCLTLNGVVPQFFGGRFFGAASIAGLDTLDYSISRLAQYVGAVFEDPETQLVTASVKNEIAFAMENFCFRKEDIFARIPEVLEAVRLEGTEDKHPQELSGGQKQRLAIAAALAYQPKLLVLDEPTSQLDPVGTQEVFSVVRELNRELGMTIVMASHAAEEMAAYADRIALLGEGRLVQIGTPEEMYSNVSMLEDYALRPPQVSRSFYLIQERGVPVKKVPVRLEEGLSRLADLKNSLSPTLPEFPLRTSKKEDHPVFEVENLSHTYPDGTNAISDISLRIDRGEYVLIIGQNGAGKSTLVRHFLKLLEPTRGRVLVEGVDTSGLSVSDLACRIGYVAQNPDNQIFNTTVEKEVSFALENLKFSEKEIRSRTEESLVSMGLWERREAHPLSLPKGDRARVVIAAILAMKPEMIIFDEPTTGQDYRGARYILDISRTLHDMGKTVVVITHHLYLMPEYAERVIVMGKGNILLDAPIREAYHQTDVLGSTFLKAPQAVMLSKEMERQAGRDYRLLTPDEVASCFTGAGKDGER